MQFKWRFRKHNIYPKFEEHRNQNDNTIKFSLNDYDVDFKKKRGIKSNEMKTKIFRPEKFRSSKTFLKGHQHSVNEPLKRIQKILLFSLVILAYILFWKLIKSLSATPKKLLQHDHENIFGQGNWNEKSGEQEGKWIQGKFFLYWGLLYIIVTTIKVDTTI